MQQHHLLVFIEVRLRSSPNFGSALESVSMTKQKKLINTASYFLKTNAQFSDFVCRFDIITFNKVSLMHQRDQIFKIDNEFYQLKWIINALEGRPCIY
jgi:putative endonuclease